MSGMKERRRAEAAGLARRAVVRWLLRRMEAIGDDDAEIARFLKGLPSPVVRWRPSAPASRGCTSRRPG